MTTVHEMRALYDRVSQMIVLSRSKLFLLGVWNAVRVIAFLFVTELGCSLRLSGEGIGRSSHVR